MSWLKGFTFGTKTSTPYFDNSHWKITNQNTKYSLPLELKLSETFSQIFSKDVFSNIFLDFQTSGDDTTLLDSEEQNFDDLTKY